jgi:hypothetical protein
MNWRTCQTVCGVRRKSDLFECCRAGGAPTQGAAGAGQVTGLSASVVGGTHFQVLQCTQNCSGHGSSCSGCLANTFLVLDLHGHDGFVV